MDVLKDANVASCKINCVKTLSRTTLATILSTFSLQGISMSSGIGARATYKAAAATTTMITFLNMATTLVLPSVIKMNIQKVLTTIGMQSGLRHGSTVDTSILGSILTLRECKLQNVIYSIPNSRSVEYMYMTLLSKPLCIRRLKCIYRVPSGSLCQTVHIAVQPWN